MGRSLPSPLRVRGFPALLGSYTINEIGDSVGLVALSILVYDRTRDPLATAALFVAAKFLPAFLAPALTARVDQLPLRRILPLAYTAEAAAFVALAMLVDAFWLPAVLALAVVDGVLALLGRGLTRGAVAALLTPRGLLRDGNAAMNVAFGAASVVGLLLGGLLVSGVGLQAALLADAASFACIAAVLASSRHLPGAAAHREPFLARLKGGLGFVRRTRPVRLLLVWQGMAMVFFTLVIPIEVVYAKETLGAGDAGFGLLLASWSAGIVIGSLLYIGVRRSSPMALILGSTFAVALGYLGMASVDDLVPACLFSVVGGLGNGIQWVSVMTLLQESTPEDLQARVAGMLESIGAAVPGVGFLLGGVLTALASPPTAYAVAGGGALALVVAGALASGTLGRGQPVTESS